MHDDLLLAALGPDAFDEEYRVHEVHYVPSSLEPDTPPIDNHPIIDAPPSHESEAPPTRNRVISYAPWAHEWETPPTGHHLIGYSTPSHEWGTPPTNSFLSDETKGKLKQITAFVVVAGTFYAIFLGSLAGGDSSYVSAIFHPSPSDTELIHKHSYL